jgi:hypothetical protein
MVSEFGAPRSVYSMVLGHCLWASLRPHADTRLRNNAGRGHDGISHGMAAGIGSSQLVDLFHPLRGQPCLLIRIADPIPRNAPSTLYQSQVTEPRWKIANRQSRLASRTSWLEPLIPGTSRTPPPKPPADGIVNRGPTCADSHLQPGQTVDVEFARDAAILSSRLRLGER